ncbi:MAG: NAD(P)H-dependent oxidoreductase [Qipengyuania sp.]
MKIFLLDAHPDRERFASYLMDIYRQALPVDAEVELVAVREIAFNPILRHGYRKRTEWEPGLHDLAAKLDTCDHLVIAFRMWWGSEPAEIKGLLDRLLLPGFAFAYRDNSSLWDEYLTGRSADVIATMDTPPLSLRLLYGNALVTRWKRQVLGSCGFKTVRVLACGPIKHGGWEKGLPRWRRKIEHFARSISPARTDTKTPQLQAFLERAQQGNAKN